MKETIYLVGQISIKAEETYNWRKRFTKLTKDDFNIIDPCATEFNIEIMNEPLKEKGFESYYKKGVRLLCPKDKTYVKRSSICVANLNWYDTEKLIIGSFFELAWYHDYPEKSVIGILDKKYPYADTFFKYPFIQDVVKVWVKDENEAAELVKYYFKGV